MRRKVVAKSDPKPVIYARVSTKKQGVNGVSIADQVDRCLAECSKRGYGDVLTLTESASAKDTDRPELLRAFDLLASGERNCLVVTKLDRLCRSAKDTLELAELSKKQGWDVIVLDGAVAFDTTTPAGTLQLTMMAALAQWEREQIRERILAAMKHKRANGDHGLISNDTEARIIEMYTAGCSMGEIARRLNRDRVPTAKGGIWYPSTLSRVLDRAGL